MKKLLQVFREWIQVKSNLTLIIAISSAIVVMLGVTVFFLLRSPQDRMALNGQVGSTQTHTNELRHPLTGAVLVDSLVSLPQVFAVMIENSSDAWPLAGLEEAFLVIEAPVEGGIPRFTAFYSEQDDVAKIGPVRSARPYYLDWADELQAVYAHVGGSPEALDLIKQVGTIDLNEFWNGQYFWRDTKRLAPHNAYTSVELLNAALSKLSLSTPAYQSWHFKHDDPVAADQVLSLTVDWGSANAYDVTWEYQPESNAYLRQQGGEIAKTQAGGTILANNVIAIATDITVVDGVGRRHIRTLGEGDAVIMQDGRLILGRWKKSTRTDRLRFYTVDGSEVSMNAGKTWIEIVPSLDKTDTFTALQP